MQQAAPAQQADGDNLAAAGDRAAARTGSSNSSSGHPSDAAPAAAGATDGCRMQPCATSAAHASGASTSARSGLRAASTHLAGASSPRLSVLFSLVDGPSWAAAEAAADCSSWMLGKQLQQQPLSSSAGTLKLPGGAPKTAAAGVPRLRLSGLLPLQARAAGTVTDVRLQPGALRQQQQQQQASGGAAVPCAPPWPGSSCIAAAACLLASPPLPAWHGSRTPWTSARTPPRKDGSATARF